MAESILSAVLPMLIEKLVSETSNSIAHYKEIGAEIEKCQDSLKSIQDVLADASQKEITNQAVKGWLNKLQHLAYDIDDILDGWATDAMSREFTHDSETFTSKVRMLLPSCCTNFSPSMKMHEKLERINTRLESLLKQRVEFGLKVEDETRPKINNRKLQTSVVNPSRIFGRQAEKEALVQQLLLPANEPVDPNYSIVPIVGMGGIGKTTLARLLYDDQQVKDHFKLKAWVCISDDFDIPGVSKEIFVALGGQVNKELENFSKLQEALRDHLTGKRFLLVLDDVWSESHEDWETFIRPFFKCAPGSKIIITTRKDTLLKRLGCGHQDQLQSLTHDDALSLFALHALGVNNFDKYVSLKPHGEAIVEKCDRLPLALIALGTLLRTKEDEASWKGVIESEIWKLPNEREIIPALRLSYQDLSGPLKQLFAYCSLFPKDFLFDKEDLVLLWMAEGFLHQPTSNDYAKEQQLGHKYFDELLSRSFFQHAPNDDSLFIMHDLMNDLATSAATGFFLRLDNENEKNIRKEMLEQYRHMSFVHEEYVSYKKFEAFTRAKSLRTFLASSVGVIGKWDTFYLSNKILVDLVCELPLLRVLSLSDFEISEIPDSISTLKHLRYLNLSQTKITKLPEEVCNLYNLQTLILSGCNELSKLPDNFRKLENLRHLNIRDTPLLFQMLVGIGELKSLQINLSKIIIGSESGFEIAKLIDLENLCGKICIKGLQKVQSAIHAHDANLSQKKISELKLEWSDELHGLRNETLEKEVLNELKPCHDTLIQLNILSYGGSEFPKWVGDPMFLHLKHVSLSGCNRCKYLPPLGQLPSLKELFIKSLYGVEAVDFKLTGAGGAFLSLEILIFKDMLGWKKWSGAVLPCLQKLQIYDCPNLVEVTLEAMPSLNVPEIDNCPNLVEVTLEGLPSLNDLSVTKCDSGVLRRLVEVASAVSKLEIRDISGLNDVVWGGVIEYLSELEELKIWDCSEIKHLVKSEAVASKNLVKLKKLEVKECDNLVSIGEKEVEDNCRSNLLPSLRILEVWGCKNMERCICPDGIEELKVDDCSSMTVVSFPKGGLEKLRSLKIRKCSKLLERELGGQQMNNNNRISMPMLEDLCINNWPNLKSINELNCLVHLTELTIYDCESLESFPDNLTTLKELLIMKCPKLDGSFLGDNLTSLKRLRLVDCKSMDASLPGWVWPPNLRSLEIGMLKKPLSEWAPQKKLPTTLVELELWGEGEDGVDRWSQISHILPSSLTELKILCFEKLESVSIGDQELNSLQSLYFWFCPNMKKVCWHPQNLTSLQYLNIWDCPKMELPEKDSLTSLLSLTIEGYCPILKERCSKNGTYWTRISHIPDIHIID